MSMQSLDSLKDLLGIQYTPSYAAEPSRHKSAVVQPSIMNMDGLSEYRHDINMTAAIIAKDKKEGFSFIHAPNPTGASRIVLSCIIHKDGSREKIAEVVSKGEFEMLSGLS